MSISPTLFKTVERMALDGCSKKKIVRATGMSMGDVSCVFAQSPAVRSRATKGIRLKRITRLERKVARAYTSWPHVCHLPEKVRDAEGNETEYRNFIRTDYTDNKHLEPAGCFREMGGSDGGSRDAEHRDATGRRWTQAHRVEETIPEPDAVMVSAFHLAFVEAGLLAVTTEAAA